MSDIQSDLAALRRTAELYAHGADRQDKSLWRAILADDCIIEGPGFRAVGLQANLASLDILAEMFRATLHKVHSQIADIEGDSAFGETYCTAEHLLPAQDTILSWSIRYQDSWRKQDGVWRFTARKLIVVWQETRPAIVNALG